MTTKQIRVLFGTTFLLLSAFSLDNDASLWLVGGELLAGLVLAKV